MTAATPAQEVAAPKKPRRLFLKIFLLVVVIVAGVLGYRYWEALKYPDRSYSGQGEEIIVTIPKGAGPKQIAEELSKKGVINDPEDFADYLNWWDLYGKVKAGEHPLKDNLTPRQIVDLLA